MGAPAAAIALRRAERRIVDYLRAERATSPDRAAMLPDLRLIERRRLARLLAARVILETGDGRFWLDEDMYRGYRSDRRALALVVLAIVGTSVIGVLLSRLF